MNTALFPHEIIALKKAIALCIESESPISADVLLGLLRRIGHYDVELESRAKAMVKEHP